MVLWRQNVMQSPATEHQDVSGRNTLENRSRRSARRLDFILGWQRKRAPMGNAPSHVSQHQKKHGAISAAVSFRRLPKRSLGNVSKAAKPAQSPQQSLQLAKPAQSQQQAKPLPRNGDHHPPLRNLALARHVPGNAIPENHSLRPARRLDFILEWQKRLAPKGNVPSHASRRPKKAWCHIGRGELKDSAKAVTWKCEEGQAGTSPSPPGNQTRPSPAAGGKKKRKKRGGKKGGRKKKKKGGKKGGKKKRRRRSM